MDAITLLYSDSHGIYIPQLFVRECLEPRQGTIVGVDDWPRGECLAGPETDGYWEAWDEILSRFEYHLDGHVYRLMQDGDLWLYCYERMTNEEKHNFGFDD